MISGKWPAHTVARYNQKTEYRIQKAEYIMIWGKWLHRQVWYSQEREQTCDITRIHQCLPFLCKHRNAKNITLFMIKRAEDLSIITHEDHTSTCVLITISILKVSFLCLASLLLNCSMLICNHFQFLLVLFASDGFQCKHVSSWDLNWVVFNATGFLCIWTFDGQAGFSSKAAAPPVTANWLKSATKWSPPCLLARRTFQKYYCSSSGTTSC